MNIKKSIAECGRSMTEMLGVLAIIGVLSIGGMTSFRYAMDKIKADKILYTVNLMALIGYTQLMNGQELNLSGFGDTIEGYPVTYRLYGNGDCRFIVRVNASLPRGIRKNLIEASFDMPFLWLVKDGVGNNCYLADETPNNFEFYFVAPFSICTSWGNVCKASREKCQQEGKELAYATTVASGAVCK